MPILATNNTPQRELVPAGNHIARCYLMIEIGTIQEIIDGESRIQKKGMIGWELPDELREFQDGKGDQPYVLSKEYNLSMNENSNLRKDLKSWRGKDFTEDEAKSFDVTRLIGVPCMLNIIHKAGKKDASKTYDQIASISSLPKSINCPPPVNKAILLSYDAFDWDVYNKLPDWIKKKIAGSIEYAALKIKADTSQLQPPVPNGIGEPDDLPF